MMLDTLTGNFLLNNYTFAQWHCKLPNDPDTKKPPKETDPGDEGPKPPKPTPPGDDIKP